MSRQLSVAPEFVGLLRLLVEQRRVSVQELHDMLAEVGVDTSQRTLQRWVYADVVENCLHPPARPPERGSWMRGERHPNNTLSKEQVRRIYMSRRSATDLADIVGCAPENIYHILRKRRWAWYTDQLDEEAQRG